MSPQYGITAPYNAGPITTASGPQSIPAPHYPTHSAYPYGSYHNSPPVPALGSPFKQEYPNSRHPGMDEDGHRGSTYTRNLKMSDDYPARSPSARSGSVSTTKSAGANPNSASKCITLNETLNPADQVNFNTDIDKLMKVIQDTNKRSSSQSDTPLQTPKSERVGEAQSPASPDSVGSAHTDTADLKKKYVCDGPNCNKRFSQKTHLQIHARTHSGEKPFVSRSLVIATTVSLIDIAL
jgi:ubiquitin-protein ligase